jgi:hypothetical protein
MEVEFLPLPPFRKQKIMNPTETEVLQPAAVESITRGEIDIAINTARRFPRQPAVVRTKMMSLATMDTETAEACFYTLPRGGKNIQGPSVRLAEIAVACYQNLRVGTRIIQTVSHGENPHVVIQAVCFDLENNSCVTIEKRRRIVGKKSKGGAIDEDDINLATNACSAIAFRDSVFKIVPLILVKPVFEAARKVAIGDAKTLVDRRAKCLETFAKMGISKERVLAKLERKSVDEIVLDDIEVLLGLHNAIRENEIAPDEAFPSIAQAAKTTAPAAPAPPTPATTSTQPPPAASEPPVANVSEGAATPTPTTGEVRHDLTAKSKAESLGLTEPQCLRYLQSLRPPMARSTNKSLAELSDAKLISFIAALDDPALVEDIKKIVIQSRE